MTLLYFHSRLLVVRRLILLHLRKISFRLCSIDVRLDTQEDIDRQLEDCASLVRVLRIS